MCSFEQSHSYTGVIFSSISCTFSSPVTAFAISNNVIFLSSIFEIAPALNIDCSIFDISSSVASGIGVIIYPPADLTPFLSTKTPKATAVFFCSDFAKYSAKSSAISPETSGHIPTYGSFKPMSFITFINPAFPTAPPTSNFPISFNGKSTTGFAT